MVQEIRPHAHFPKRHEYLVYTGIDPNFVLSSDYVLSQGISIFLSKGLDVR